jgi:hypothetical protein
VLALTRLVLALRLHAPTLRDLPRFRTRPWQVHIPLVRLRLPALTLAQLSVLRT